MIDQLINLAGVGDSHPFWSLSFLGNTALEYATALIALILITIGLKIFQSIILLRLGQIAKKTQTDIDDTLIKITRSIKPLYYLYLAFFLSLNFLHLHHFAKQLALAILIVWTVYQTIHSLEILINFITDKYLGETTKSNQSAMDAIKLFSKLGLWGIGSLLILSNLGVNITSLIAGLGIGGIAIALALQNILTDLFSSFTIYIDKPFQVGDTIQVDPHQGKVEKIGIKTTRIRALSGEQIVISNRELTSVRIQNFKNMKARRVAFNLGLTYQTPTKKLRSIPKILKSIISKQKGVRFDRATLLEFGDSALVYEVIYFLDSREYKLYTATQHKISLAVLEAFEKDQIDIAYPTQTVHLSKQA